MSNEHPGYGNDPLKKPEEGQPTNAYGSGDSAQAPYSQPANGNSQQYPGYGQNPYSQPPAQAQGAYQVPQGYPQSSGYMGEVSEGKKHADTSLVLSIIGLFVAPLILGIFGLVYANKAEKLGHPATAGKIISWVDIALSIVGFIFLIFFFVVVGAAETSSTYSSYS